jgi:hypothetical protein
MVIFAAVLCFAAPSRADIAPNPLTTGGTNIALKDPAKGVPIKMVWEEVDLYPTAAKNRVEAVFLMKNVGKEAVSLTVGFPSYFQVALADFKAEIDGKEQLAEVQKTGGNGPKKIFTYWLCWPMKFAKGQEHKVRVTYWCKTEPVFDYFETLMEKDLRSKLSRYWSGYVLRTGAAWEGNIGKATIRLHYGDQVKKALMTELEPAGNWKYDEQRNTATLVLEDFKPASGESSNSDVRYQFKLVSQEEEAKLLLAALKDKRLEPWGMQRLLQPVEKDNVLKLEPKERASRVIQILELMVPPKGPRLRIQGPNDQADNTFLSGGAEEILREAFGRLLAHYKSEKNNDAEAKLRKEYVAFLKPIVEREEKRFRDARFRRGQFWERFQKMKREYKAMAALVAEQKKE